MFVCEFCRDLRGQPVSYFNKAIMLWLGGVVFQWYGLLLTTALVRLKWGYRKCISPSPFFFSAPLPTHPCFFSSAFVLPLTYRAVDTLECMGSSLSHFSHTVGLKDKDGLCSEGLIDQNNCASICLLKAEQTTASQGLYFHRLSQPLMLLTWVVLIRRSTAWQTRNIWQSHLKASLS